MKKYSKTEIQALKDLAAEYDSERWDRFDQGVETAANLLRDEDFDSLVSYLYNDCIEPLEDALEKVRELDQDAGGEDYAINEALYCLEDAEGTQDWVFYNSSDYTVETPDHYMLSDCIQKLLANELKEAIK